jgi:hypothetical protein
MMFERREIELQPGFGRFDHIRKIDAIVYGDWAAHRHLDVPDLFVLTLLPVGRKMPPEWCSFRTEQQACDAMVEIARLKNSWSVVTQSDLTIELRDQMMAIAASHGAVEGPLAQGALLDHSRLGLHLKRRPNGYGPALD